MRGTVYDATFAVQGSKNADSEQRGTVVSTYPLLQPVGKMYIYFTRTAGVIYLISDMYT